MNMAEVLAQFPDPLSTPDGSTYVAQACGAPNPQGLWEAWIEFVPVNGGQPLRSSRETTQPNRTDAEYWATGLTMVYLEGALNRALNPPVRKVVTKPHAMFDEPSRSVAVTTLPNATQDAILDPFSLYEKGEKLLRQELGALASWHLVNIARAYGLSDEPAAILNALPAAPLVEIIVRGVRSRAGVPRRRSR
jgi:hypothetical protein